MEFIETPIFTKEIRQILDDEEYRQLQLSLLLRPDMGVLIRGSGGIRKMRWQGSGKGKSGGMRVIYYLDLPDTVFMLFAYRKNEQEDLTHEQLKSLKNLIEEYLL